MLTISHSFIHTHTHTQHDPDTRQECTPSSSQGGRFIMYAFANDLSDRNNMDFSICSREMMDNVIAVRGQGLLYTQFGSSNGKP